MFTNNPTKLNLIKQVWKQTQEAVCMYSGDGRLSEIWNQPLHVRDMIRT